MATYFVDLDGTTFHDGTNDPLPNAMECLRNLLAVGNQIVFTTKRADVRDAQKVLEDNGLGGPLVLSGLTSPRIVINDHGAKAINHPTDEPWGDMPSEDESGGRVLTCVYCGHQYPQDTPAWGSQVLTDHIRTCEKHPMREAEETIRRMQGLLRRAASETIGLEGSTIKVDIGEELDRASGSDSDWKKKYRIRKSVREMLDAKGK